MLHATNNNNIRANMQARANHGRVNMNWVDPLNHIFHHINYMVSRPHRFVAFVINIQMYVQFCKTVSSLLLFFVVVVVVAVLFASHCTL